MRRWLLLAVLAVCAVVAAEPVDASMNDDYRIRDVQFIGYACAPTPHETSVARSPRADILGAEVVGATDLQQVSGEAYILASSVTQYSFTGYANERTNPRHVEGEPHGGDPDAGGDRPLISLGQAGWFVGRMGLDVADGPGDDLIIWEASRPGVPESFCVYGSVAPAGPFYYVGLHVADERNDNEAHAFDLADDYLAFADVHGVTELHYLMVLDSADADATIDVDFIYAPELPLSQVEVQFTDVTTRFDARPFTTRLWDLGDGTTSTEEHPAHTYARAGTYAVCLHLEDDEGFSGDACHDVVVRNRLPDAVFSWADAGGGEVRAGAPVQFQDLSTDAEDGTPVAWRWDFGDGTTSNLAAPVHTYARGRTYDVTLVVTDADGGSDIVRHQVAVANGPPTAAFTPTTAAFATDQDILLADESFDIDGDIVRWQWDIGDDGTIDHVLQEPRIRFADLGSYIVRLTVTDDVGATDTTTRTIFIGNRSPVAGIERTGGPATFDAFQFTSTSIDPDGEIVRWHWAWSDAKAEGPGLELRFDDDGHRIMKLIVWDDEGAMATASHPFDVANRPPQAAFTLTRDGASTVDAQLFTDVSTDADGRVAAWDWDFGDGLRSKAPNPTHVYADKGTYDVVLTVTDDDGASSTSTMQLLIDNQAPVARFSFSVRDGQVHVSDASRDIDDSLATFSWTFWDGTTAGGPTAVHAIPPDGVPYPVALAVTDARGATAHAQVYVRSDPPPSASDGGPLTEPPTLDEEQAADQSGSDPATEDDQRPPRTLPRAGLGPTHQDASAQASAWVLLILIPIALVATAIVWVIERRRSRT